MQAACIQLAAPMDTLRQLQEDIAAKLAAETEFQYVPVSVFRPRDSAEALLIQSAIDKALAGLITQNGKAGLAVVVYMPEAETLQPNAPGPQLELVATLRVVENPLVNMGANGTQTTAEQCALNILSSLHHWQRGQATLMADKKAIRPVDTPGKIALDVVVRQPSGLPMRARVPAPKFDESGPDVSLSCTMEGAAMWYTMDGTPPAPGNASATLYVGAFDPLPLVTLRAAAFKSGFLSSAISEYDV